jgi:hypothetical protein
LAFLPAAPWLARSWVLTGNPIYPFLASVFPTRDWTPEAGAAFSGLMRYYIWAEGSAGLYPTRRVALVALTFGFVAILLAIAVCRARSADRRALLGVSGFTALSGIAGAGLHFRYSLPVTPLLSALIASQAASILGRSRAVAAAALAAIALGCGLYAFRKPGPNDATPGAIDALAAATGRTSRDQYLTRRLSNYRLWKFANANLPPNSRVLLATSGASYYADFPCWITMAYHQRIFSLEDWRDFLADVEQAAITHLVSSPKLKGPRPGPEYLPARNEYAFAARLGEEFGSLLHSERGDRLYRLDRDAIAGAVREEAR